MATFNNIASFVRIEKLKRGNSPYVQVIHIPNSGPLAGKEVGVGNFATRFDKPTIDVLKSLKEGDIITLEVEQPEGTKFRNLMDVTKGEKKKFAKAASGDYNDRAAKGQALNLAMQVAIAEGRAHDDEYILSLIPRMLKLGEEVQNGTSKGLSGTTSAIQNSAAQKSASQKSTTATREQSSAASSTIGATKTDTGSEIDATSTELDDLFAGDL